MVSIEVSMKHSGGDESKVVMQISPGKAYVKGYSIDKTGTTNLEINKEEQQNHLQTQTHLLD